MPLGLILVTFGVYSQLDALYPVIERLSPSEDLHIPKIPLRYFVFYFAVTDLFRTEVTFLSMAIVFLMALNNSTRITQVAGNAKRFSWRGFSVSPAALKTIKIYKMIQVYLNN